MWQESYLFGSRVLKLGITTDFGESDRDVRWQGELRTPRERGGSEWVRILLPNGRAAECAFQQGVPEVEEGQQRERDCTSSPFPLCVVMA